MDRLFDTVRPLSLVRLSSELARSVATIGRVVVEGEVVRPRTTGAGRVYFTLRDRAAQITVVVPAGRRVRAEHGERVAVTGTPNYTPDRGEVTLTAEEVSPVGAGAIAALIAEVRSRLAADGLLTRPRRPLPLLPAAIGVVCGTDAAVRADIESVVASRFPGYPMVFAEATVSGPGAAASMVAALAALDRDLRVEVVILARGGGDAAQLLPFSDEDLCRAVCATRVPVVVAVGHEGDRPLCDEVADLRCATPSLAAAAVVPDRQTLAGAADALLRAAGAAVDDARQREVARLAASSPERALDSGHALAAARLERGGRMLTLLHPGPRVAAARSALARAEHVQRAEGRLAVAAGALEQRAATLAAVDPARVLRRGYAVVTDETGAVLRSAGQTGPGRTVSVRLAEGSLRATVEAAENGRSGPGAAA
ncbi:MAG TPA: exodeoxyribonuclease VII large subunit [Acidimicrobiales bacterium]|nr:exodeoxyribonuclease VII large subunit [Acidimicrobiales bacterium]